MGNVAKYQHGWNMTFTVVELLMIIPKSTYLSISLPYFSIYHFFSLTLLEQVVIMGSFIIEGGYALSVSIRPQGAKNEVLEVIRTGISLMIAAMSADGVGVIGGVEQTGRGYEDIDGRLNALEVRTERQY